MTHIHFLTVGRPHGVAVLTRGALPLVLSFVLGIPFLQPVFSQVDEPQTEKTESYKTPPLHVPAGAQWLDIRHSAKCEEMRKRGKEIDTIMLGDSITHLWSWDKPNDPYNEPYRGDEVWGRYFNDPGILNFAFDSGTIQSTIAHLDTAPLSEISPRVAVILIGVNNIRAGNTPQSVAEGIVSVENRLRQAFPGIRILQLAIFPTGQYPNDPNRTRATETNRLLREMIADAGDVTFLDIGPDLLEPNGEISPDIMPDFLHVNPTGFEIWAQKMKPVLDRLRGVAK